MTPTTNLTPVTTMLAEFVAATTWEQIPEVVRHEAKRSLMNFFAVALGGCRDPAIEKASEVFRGFRSGQEATVIGRGERSDILHAASLNAMSANVFDFDDTHIPTILHPTAPVAPPLFALAESSRMSGQQLLLAFVLGVEVEGRLANAVHPSHYQRGWHITSTCGVFGAAAATAKSLGLDAKRIAYALGSASAQAGGLVETLGTMAKSIGVGNAASNGLLSALLAQRGYDGPDQPLEGQRGFLKVTSENPKFEAVTAELGKRWELRANTYKPYPCGVVLNPVIEACLMLYAGPGLSVAQIERIEIVGHSLLRERTDRPNIKTGRESQVSAQHAVAVALTRGKAGLPEFSDAAVADPQLRALGAKVVFIDDDKYSVESARVTLVMRSGPARSIFVEQALGSLARPLSDTDLEQKLITLTQHGRSQVSTEQLIAAVWSLDQNANAGAIMQIAAGHA